MPIAPRNGELSEKRARSLLSQATYDPLWPKTIEEADGRLTRDSDFESKLFAVCEGNAIEVIMAADPFCYLSHASAIEFHGFAPNDNGVHVMMPDRTLWQGIARNYMASILESEFDQSENGEQIFPLVKPRPNEIVRGDILYRHQTRYPIEHKVGLDTHIRTTPLGITFRDALENLIGVEESNKSSAFGARMQWRISTK